MTYIKAIILVQEKTKKKTKTKKKPTQNTKNKTTQKKTKQKTKKKKKDTIEWIISKKNKKRKKTMQCHNTLCETTMNELTT